MASKNIIQETQMGAKNSLLNFIPGIYKKICDGRDIYNINEFNSDTWDLCILEILFTK